MFATQFRFIAAIAVSRAGFGRANNTVRIVLDNVRCVGNEMDLLSCWHSPLGVHNCGHREDAGVICQGSLATAGKWKTSSHCPYICTIILIYKGMAPVVIIQRGGPCSN